MNTYGGVTLALYRGEWSASRPYLFTPRDCPRYALDRRLGGPQSRSGRYGEEKNLTSVGNRTPVVQPIDRH
jgi:hypothetical protein